MKKFLLLVCIFALPLLALSQSTYPIQTLLKGDSVVIYTVEQDDDNERLLANQRKRVDYYKNSITKQEQIIDSLKNRLSQRDTEIDSLCSVIEYKFANYDSLEERQHIAEKWLYNTAIDNAYIYYSYADSSLMAIDLSSYVLIGYKRSGNFSIVRKGPITEDADWKAYNRANRESPSADWLMYYKERWRPSLIKFPYKIEVQP